MATLREAIRNRRGMSSTTSEPKTNASMQAVFERVVEQKMKEVENRIMSQMEDYIGEVADTLFKQQLKGDKGDMGPMGKPGRDAIVVSNTKPTNPQIGQLWYQP